MTRIGVSLARIIHKRELTGEPHPSPLPGQEQLTLETVAAADWNVPAPDSGSEAANPDPDAETALASYGFGICFQRKFGVVFVVP